MSRCNNVARGKTFPLKARSELNEDTYCKLLEKTKPPQNPGVFGRKSPPMKHPQALLPQNIRPPPTSPLTLRPVSTAHRLQKEQGAAGG